MGHKPGNTKLRLFHIQWLPFFYCSFLCSSLPHSLSLSLLFLNLREKEGASLFRLSMFLHFCKLPWKQEPILYCSYPSTFITADITQSKSLEYGFGSPAALISVLGLSYQLCDFGQVTGPSFILKYSSSSYISLTGLYELNLQSKHLELFLTHNKNLFIVSYYCYIVSVSFCWR